MVLDERKGKQIAEIKLDIIVWLKGSYRFSLVFNKDGAELTLPNEVENRMPLHDTVLRYSVEEAELLQERFMEIHTECWKREYVNHLVLDGTSWRFNVCYCDGGVQEYSGSNDYPDNWDELLRLFGAEEDETIL